MAISIAWPLISLLILTVAFGMAECASAMPTAGGIYYWASRLGGPGWGWFTGWFNLIGLVAVTASVVYVSTSFLMNLLGLYNLHFIFNFARAAGLTKNASIHYTADVNFALFAVVITIHGLINAFRSQPGLDLHLDLRLVARDRCRGDHRAPGRGPLAPRQSVLRVRAPVEQLRLLEPHVLVLRASARLPAHHVHDHRVRRLGPRLRGDHRSRRVGAQGRSGARSSIPP